MKVNHIRGRFAPSPTGLMHVGNARTALAAWLSIRKQGGTFVWRLEDLDIPRVVPGMSEAAALDLKWMGLDWDEGPELGGSYAPYKQSLRFDRYEEALRKLQVQDRIFPCALSRKDLQSIASAPHGMSGTSPYPIKLRPDTLEADWFQSLLDADQPHASIRFKVLPGQVTFDDWAQGLLSQNVLEEVGDYVIKRRDGMYAYQLAVVVDDIAMDITEVVRGSDLVDSTARQIQLIQALGGQVPAYAHVPLVLNHLGEKLSKRDEGLTIQSLRENGVQPEQLVGYLAYSMGLINEIIPVSTGALIDHFRWEVIDKKDWVLPENVAEVLRDI